MVEKGGTAAAPQSGGEEMGRFSGLSGVVSSVGEKFLCLQKGGPVDDGGLCLLQIVLGHLAVIDFLDEGEAVGGVALLQEGIPDVLFILQDVHDGGALPGPAGPGGYRMMFV